MRFTEAGKAVTSFSMAVDRRGATGDATDWFDIVTWEKLAEVCNQYLHKGSLVYVEGRLQTRSWEGDDGVKRYRTELIASNVQFLDGVPTTHEPAEDGGAIAAIEAVTPQAQRRAQYQKQPARR
jgi:single-strand DNA-binding protein